MSEVDEMVKDAIEKDIEEKSKQPRDRSQNLAKRLFQAQRALDDEVVEPVQLIGAMRQALHSQQLSVVLDGWTFRDEFTIEIAFSLRYGADEWNGSAFEYRLKHFNTFQELVYFAWKTYLHGLFGRPEIPSDQLSRANVEEPSVSMPPPNQPIGVRPQGQSVADLLQSMQ